MRESTIEKEVCKFAKEHGCLVMKLAGPNQKGQPDRMFIRKGKVLFMEFKAPGKLPTALQWHWIGKLEDQSMKAVYVDTVENGKWFIEQILL